MTGPLLRIDGLTKRFGGLTAVDGVSLEVEHGTLTAVLGPSGAGKSTLLRAVNGLVTPDAGSVVVDGLPVTRANLRRVRRRVGFVFQAFHLVGRLNVMTNVLVGRSAFVPGWMSLLHLFPRADFDKAAAALEAVGMAEKAWERADRLSGGQQQRVAIARALAQEPRLILADEPIASLDPVTGRQVMALLRRECLSRGIALLVNLHQVDAAREFADRVVGLRRGRVVFDGPPAALTGEVLRGIYGDEPPGQPTHSPPAGPPSNSNSSAGTGAESASISSPK